MAAILRSERTFKPEVTPEVKSYFEIGHAIPYILSFDRRSSLKIDGVMVISKSDIFFDLVTQLFDLWPN